MFGSGGKRAFAVGAGAGFAGGAVASAGAMSVYHRYQTYKAIRHYRGFDNGGVRPKEKPNCRGCFSLILLDDS